MPTFLSRRYMRPIKQVGMTERVIGVALLLLTAGIVVAFVVQAATNTDYLFEVDDAAYAAADPAANVSGGAVAPPDSVVGKNPFPDPDIEGWQPPGRVSRYKPENLYTKINGRAPAYSKFGVVALIFGTYSRETEAGRTVDVYWYDMGQAANASAIYRAEAPPAVTPIPIGSEGYEVGGAVFFWKGSSYVQVLPSGLDEADALAARRIAERLAEGIEDR